MSAAIGGLAAAATALGAFWELLKKASQQQTALNKALIEGTGTANDFVIGGKTYTEAIDDMRQAAMDAHGALLKFGMNSEKSLKVINAFAKESTGSLIKTRTALKSLGDGDVAKGIEDFTKSAVAYGKALGMEATEVADMMGKMVSETGYGASQIQDQMSMVVKAAATSNMPMTKFMGIFRRVLPDVELYQNRLEELTGTIKLLSKTMSAKDVQNFMDAFANGFKGMDFKQRLKTVLVTGVGNVSKALDKDFTMKAKSIAKNFRDYGVSEDDFVKAMKGGEKAMADLMAKAQGNAIAKGGEIAGVHISDAMKLASYEEARQKGGPLNTATAMRGGGMFATYSILKQMSQRFTSGFDGLSEHVIKQLGISEQQYEALRTTSQSLEVYRSQLDKAGRTQSKSMNEALKEAIAQRKGLTGLEKETVDLREATEEDLFLAAEMSNKDEHTARTAEDLATQQVTLTQSIDEKLDNVIAFLLEKIYGVLNSKMLELLGEIEEAASTDDRSKAEMKKLSKVRHSDLASGPQTAGQKMQQEVRSEALRDAIAQGIEGTDLIGAMKGQYTTGQLGTASASMADWAISKGMDAKKADEMSARFREKLESGDVNAALWQLKEIPASWEETLEALNVVTAHKSSELTDTVQEKMKDPTIQGRRDGTTGVDIIKKKAELDKIERAAYEASDADKAYAAAIAGGPIPASSAGSAPAAKAQVDASKNVAVQTNAATAQVGLNKDQVDKQTSIAASTASVYDAVTDVYGVLKKGIVLEGGFLRGAFADTMRTSMLDALRTALLEFAVIMARMQTSEDFATFMADWSWQITQAGGAKGMSALTTMNRTGASDDLYEEFGNTVSGSRLSGGPINDTGLYKLHRGEYVVPALPAVSQTQSSGPVYATVIIQGSNLSQQQLEAAAYNVLDKVARRA